VHALASGAAAGTLFTDEVRCPVHVADLAAALLELAASPHAGVCHVAGADAISRYELGLQVTLPFTGLSFPTKVAVDGAGNVFVADSGNNRVVELPNEVAACTTTITGAHPVPLAVTSGLTCLEHAVQDGHVTVGPGAAPLSGRQHRRGDRRRHPAVRACLGAGQHRDRADHRRRQHRQRVAVLRRQHPRTIRQRRRQHRHRGGHRAVRRPRQALTGPGSRIARRRSAWRGAGLADCVGRSRLLDELAGRRARMSDAREGLRCSCRMSPGG
jgi:hypothetical protein